MLDNIYQWLAKDPALEGNDAAADQVADLVDGARTRHDNYVEQKKAEEEARKKAEEEEARRKAEEEEAERRRAEEEAQLYAATHYDCEYFSVEVPESMVGTWTVDHIAYTNESGFAEEKWTFNHPNGMAIVWLAPGNGYPPHWEFLGTVDHELNDASGAYALFLQQAGGLSFFNEKRAHLTIHGR